MRFAIIESGQVVNVVEGDSPESVQQIAPAALVVQSDTATPGELYRDGVFIAAGADIPTVRLALTAPVAYVQVGTDYPVSAELISPDGTPAPIDELYLVPIERSDAPDVAALVKGIQFSGGQAAVTLRFAASGYYRITEQGINSRLSGVRISLQTPFEVTVYD